MRCPDCKKSMVILEYKEVELDFCPTCRGVWLDEGELEQILHDRDAAMNLVDWTGGRKGERRCPRCMEKMHVIKLPNGGPEIDVCPAACGIWFDQGELRAAVRAHLSEDKASPILTTLTEMFGCEQKPNKE